jgi:hypothetical protein
MSDKETDKTPIAVSKSFMAVGPTLHYSHKNVQICWLLALAAFGVSCLFWSKIVTGGFWSFDSLAVTDFGSWRLNQSITTGVGIFEYPWQILVLGLLMGILAVVPVLISQLMSFRYSVLFILLVFFVANLPGFAICLLVSCIAAACRPLRFRSRFIAIALCAVPQLLYWGLFGGARGVEAIEWGVSFTPWICAWLDSLIIAGLVLGIGHFTRYRPGLTWVFTTLTLIIALIVFEKAIGFDELDYNLYVATNNPEHVSEFHDQSISAALDATIQDPATQEYLDNSSYPPDPIARRGELKREMQKALYYRDLWPDWFKVPGSLKYRQKKVDLNSQYDQFIKKRPHSRRIPIVLYYRAMLAEYSPDTNLLAQKEVLHFYSDYPHDRARKTWWTLYHDFGNRPESLEARWRLARHHAGKQEFKRAEELLAEAQLMLAEEQTRVAEAELARSGGLFGLFREPPDAAMTSSKLEDLHRRLDQLQLLISSENRTNDPGSIERLAMFVMLNPHASDSDYAQRLDGLLEQTEGEDRLRDNILLAQIKLIADEHGRAEKLGELHSEHPNTDGGMLALYELGILEIGMGHRQDPANPQFRQKFLERARATLEKFIELYPGSFHIDQVKKNLDGLPAK